MSSSAYNVMGMLKDLKTIVDPAFLLECNRTDEGMEVSGQMGTLRWRGLLWDTESDPSQTGGLKNRIKSIVFLGDSLTEFNNGPVTIYNMTATGGDVSFTASSSVAAGAQAEIMGAIEYNWNGPMNILTKSGTAFTAQKDGLEGSPTASSAGLFICPGQFQPANYGGYAMQSGPIPLIVRAAYKGSTTTTQLREWLVNAVIPLKPTHVHIMAGMNDVLQSVATDTIVANIQELVELCLAEGIEVILGSITPLSENGGNTIFSTSIINVNNQNRAWCQNKPGVVFVNYHAMLANPDDIYGRGFSNYYGSDTIHLNTVGHSTAAPALNSVFYLHADDFTSGLVNMVPNNDYAIIGSSGGLQVPQGCQFYRSSSVSFTLNSSVADGVWTVDVTGAAAGDALQIYDASFPSTTLSDDLGFFGVKEVQISQQLNVRILTDGGLTGFSGWNSTLFPGGYRRIFVRPYWLKSGATPNLGRLQLQCTFPVAGNYQFKLKNPQAGLLPLSNYLIS